MKGLIKIGILLVVLSIFAVVNSVSANYNKDAILAKHYLSKTIKGKKYLDFADKISVKYSKNEEKLRKLEKKIIVLKEKLKKDNSIKNKDLKALINYLYGKLKVSIEEYDNRAANNIESIFNIPKEYQDLKVKKENIFFSYMSWYFYDANGVKYRSDLPVVTSIHFVDEHSIRNFISDKMKEEEFVEDFYTQKKLLNNGKSYKDYIYKEIGNRKFHISPRGCRGDIYGCALIKYATFQGNIKIEFDVGFNSAIKDSHMEKLVETFLKK